MSCNPVHQLHPLGPVACVYKWITRHSPREGVTMLLWDLSLLRLLATSALRSLLPITTAALRCLSTKHTWDNFGNGKSLENHLVKSYWFETNSYTGPFKYHHVIFVDLGLVVLLGLDLLLDVGEDLVLASPLLGGLLYQRAFALLARLQGAQDSIKCVRWLKHLKDVSKVVEIVI